MNRYTKIAMLYFTNDRNEYFYWLNSATDILSEYTTYEEAVIMDLALEMQTYLENEDIFNFDDLPMILYDLIHEAIHDIDFYEIAKCFIELAKNGSKEDE